MYTEHSPIFGIPQASHDQCVRYLCARPHGEYSDKTISTEIVPTYWRLATSIGVDPVLAIAQLIIETGNLTSALSQRRDKDGRNLRNPGGIGVYEPQVKATQRYRTFCVWDADARDGEGGYRPACQFASWANDAIPAHLGRLAAWALAPEQCTPEQHALIAKALTYRNLDQSLQGSAPEIIFLGKAHNPMGQGWASPGDTYGEHIADVANRIAFSR